MAAMLRKLFSILITFRPLWYRSLLLGVAASVEHVEVLRSLNCRTVVDIGANRGQFALVARSSFPGATIISFEPLSAPASLFRRVFSGDDSVKMHELAIGPESTNTTMHVSGRDDSSSLLPISSLQEEMFPGTSEVDTADVRVAPLDAVIVAEDLVGPSLLKLDVQGFELEALRGCEPLLTEFQWVYCECSFVELYSGQRLAADIIEWLSDRGFRIKGIYNPSFDRDGLAIQADFMFKRVE
jgi:FkbM family methyltransferase